MEMKRREYKRDLGCPWQWFCAEFVYKVLSGYGTRYLRAGFVLIVIALIFALAYLWSNPLAFNFSLSDALRFSVKVMTLQRPVPLQNLDWLGQSFQIAQTIIGPVQIALFGLALRMRLRR